MTCFKLDFAGLDNDLAKLSCAIVCATDTDEPPTVEVGTAATMGNGRGLDEDDARKEVGVAFSLPFSEERTLYLGSADRSLWMGTALTGLPKRIPLDLATVGLSDTRTRLAGVLATGGCGVPFGLNPICTAFSGETCP